MTKVNFKTELMDSEGKPANPPILLSSLLSNLIMGSNINDDLTMKYFDWAVELSKSGVLSLDNTDKEKLTNIIKTYAPNILCKGRLFEVITAAKD